MKASVRAADRSSGPRAPKLLGREAGSSGGCRRSSPRTAEPPAEVLLDDPLDVVRASGFVKPRQDRPDLRLVLIGGAPGSPESDGVVSEDQGVHFREELRVRLLEAPPLHAAPPEALGNVWGNLVHGRES